MAEAREVGSAAFALTLTVDVPLRHGAGLAVWDHRTGTGRLFSALRGAAPSCQAGARQAQFVGERERAHRAQQREEGQHFVFGVPLRSRQAFVFGF